MIRDDDWEQGDDTFNDWDDSEEDDQIQVRSLFTPDVYLPSVEDLLTYEKMQHDFDLRGIVKELGEVDDCTLIKLVNYIRDYVNNHLTSPIDSSFVTNLKNSILSKDFLVEDKFMIPVFQDDVLLFQLSEVLGIDLNDDEEGYNSHSTINKCNGEADMHRIIHEKEKKIEELQEIIQKYRLMVNELVSTEPEPEPDNYYFNGYGALSIHEEMLRDHPRTNAYMRSFSDNIEFIKDKIVLDVGCGTGILSLFAAKYGATRVYGVDASEIMQKTRQIVDNNGYSDKIVLVESLLEDDPVELRDLKVDIIVSEWMGYGLFFENMLSSVILAREKYLSKSDSATMLPNCAELFVEAMTSAGRKDRIGWWSDVYGFDMAHLHTELLTEAQVQFVDPTLVISDRPCAQRFDLNVVSDEDLDFVMPFDLTISRDEPLHAFVVSFDVGFAHPGMGSSITLSTGPAAEDTHWKQTVLWLEPSVRRAVSVGDRVRGSVHYLRRPENRREYELRLGWSLLRSSLEGEQKVSEEFSQMYFLR